MTALFCTLAHLTSRVTTFMVFNACIRVPYLNRFWFAMVNAISQRLTMNNIAEEIKLGSSFFPKVQDSGCKSV